MVTAISTPFEMVDKLRKSLSIKYCVQGINDPSWLLQALKENCGQH